MKPEGENPKCEAAASEDAEINKLVLFWTPFFYALTLPAAWLYSNDAGSTTLGRVFNILAVLFLTPVLLGAFLTLFHVGSARR